MSGKKFVDKCAQKLELPAESFSSAMKITVVSNFRVEIENHKGLIEFSDEIIGVKGKNTIAMVRGQTLELEAMSDSQMLICGQINSIDFEVI